MSELSSSDVIFNYKSSVGVGELERYVITYDLYEGDEIPHDVLLNSLWLKVKNIERLSYRAAYLMGPFMLYCDVKTEDYHHTQKIIASVDQPKFEPNLQAQQKCIAELSVHKIKPRHVWIVDIVSQILFTTNTHISFEITIGSTKESLSDKIECMPQNGSNQNRLTVSRLTTLDVWNLPAEIYSPRKPKHLVLLTHGLHSNVSSDMAYIMEQIYKAQENYPNEQIIVKGYTGNVCQTERGVKYLGTRLAKFVIDELYDESIVKISFVGHSLGGLVQTFAIAFIAVKYPWFFERVTPINFIAIASPFLGIVTDNPAYINLLLSFGVIGKTGQDLSLENDSGNDDPLLSLLPGAPVKGIMAKFKRRTLYMNAINDGIVPLYTASLLFLDYDEILKELKKVEEDGLRSVSKNIDVAANNDFLSRNVISPLTKMISLLAPQKFPESNSKIPKVSFLESAVSTLVPPLPAKSYILDPESRDPVIIHDKVYSEKDLPPVAADPDGSFKDNTNILLTSFTVERGDRQNSQKLEEEIARKWHDGLSWRKVVVALKPDAHNNIIVRRRFANAYGWPVVDHLISVHFNGDDAEGDTCTRPIDSQDESLSIDAKQQEIEPNKDFAWITRVESSRLFDEGPTGMISTVGEMLGAFARGRFLGIPNVNSDVMEANQEDKLLSYEALNGNGP